MLDSELIPRLAALSPSASAARSADRLVSKLQQLIGSLSDGFEVHPPVASGAMPFPSEMERQVVPLGAIAHGAFDALRMEGLRTSVEPVVTWSTEAIGKATEVREMLAFNLEAAVDESVGRTDSPDTASRSELRELVLDGLANGAELLEGAATPMPSALEELSRRSRDHFADGWRHVVRRTKAGPRMADQLRGAGADLGGWLRGYFEGHRRTWKRYRRRAGALLRLTRRRVRRLIRLGSSAVGVKTAEDPEAEATLIALASVERFVGDLPRVYQRLFSFEPLEDVTLLRGRTSELAQVSRKFERWKEGMTAPVLITCAQGGGASSFLNSVTEHLDIEHAVYASLQDRLLDEGSFVRLLSGDLGIEPSPETLTELAEWLMERPRAAGPLVIVVERLEHLMLRSRGGTELIERVLTFMSLTDARVFWICSMVEDAWRLIRQTQPHTATLPFVLHLGPLDREALESIILERHRRSGHALDFRLPANGVPKRVPVFTAAPNAAEVDALAKRTFFDALHRVSAGSVALALFYWLRSVRFDREVRSVSVEPPTQLSFDYLKSLHIEQAFTLKAFLEHTTLTLAEHERVFGHTGDESFQLFESLLDRLLIVPFTVGDGPPPPEGTIEAGARYRIRPMLSWPVAEQLRRMHVLY